MQRLTIFIICSALFCFPGCKDESVTEIVVAVATDLRTPEEMDSFAFVVTRGEEEIADREYDLDPSVDGHVTLPATMGLVGKKRLSEPVLITVTGMLGATEVVQRQARVTFVEGKIKLLRIYLLRECAERATPCPVDQTCTEQGCVSIDSAKLEDYDEKEALKGIGEAGVTSDGGLEEAGPDRDGAGGDLFVDLGVSDVVKPDAGWCGDGELNNTEDCDADQLGGQSCQSQGFFGGVLHCSAQCTFETSGCHNCGNGTIDSGEQCDGSQLGGKSCTSEGFDSGTLACDSSCDLDTSGCVYTSCGDGQKNGNEDCDGNPVTHQTCQGLGYDGGALSCNSNCTFNRSGCFECGDGNLDTGEDCDGNPVTNQTCQGLGFDAGTLQCTSGCTFDTSLCTACGDGTPDLGEQCDGNPVTHETCQGLGYAGGALSCNSDCSYNLSGCYWCGDGITNGSEACDGNPVTHQTCQGLGQGFTGGTLQCNANCTFNTTMCYTCGDGVINPGEDCDGNPVTHMDCPGVDPGFSGGTLTCTSDCTYNTSQCFGCGDGTVDTGEDCDGNPVTHQTCQGLNFDGGTLQCYGDCSYNTSQCYECGDGDVDSGEDCDGTNLGGKTCASLAGYDGGNLTCTSSCTFNTSQCYSCGDGNVNPGESCDGSNLNGKSCVTQGYDGGTLGCTSGCSFDLSGCVKHTWKTISGGVFNMGRLSGDPCTPTGGAETVHQVRLMNNYEIPAYEVTRDQFQKMMGYTSWTGTCSGDCAASHITWHEAASYCNALSAAKGMSLCYICKDSGSVAADCATDSKYLGDNIYSCTGYRLPTEAEWENAYRAGSTTPLYPSTGNNGMIASSECDSSNANGDKIAWYDNTASGTIHVVGTKASNAWGLFDMAGNVMEWTQDLFVHDLGSTYVTNPGGGSSGTTRVWRGGSAYVTLKYLRASYRWQAEPDGSAIPSGSYLNYLGFRCVRTK